MSAEELAAKRCTPCRGGVEPLGREAAERLRRDVPAWSLDEDGRAIRRSFKHKGFREAMVFVNRVADLAEAEGHHPDIDIRWSRVELALSTHRIGGLHENDFILAAKIDRLAPPPQAPAG